MSEGKASGSSEPVTLPLHCQKCGGTVTLQFSDWTAQEPLQNREQPWICPYCFELNVGIYAGAVVLVTKGHGTMSPV